MRLFLGGPDGLALYEDEDVTRLDVGGVLCMARTQDGGVLAGTSSGSIVGWSGAGEHRVLAKDVGDAVTSLAAARNGRLFAGCLPACIWRSKDVGESWTPVDGARAHVWIPGQEPGRPAVLAVGAHLKDSRTLYAGVEKSGVYRSRDSGKSWHNLTLPCPDIQSIQLSSARPERVFVTTGGEPGGGAFCSDDEGITWRPIGESNRHQHTMGLAAHPTEPDRVIVSATAGPPGTWDSDASCDVYLSTDSGRRFRTVVRDLPGGIGRRGLVVNPRVPSEAVFVTSARDLWYSNDGGESFDRVAERLPDLTSVIFA